MKYGVENHSFIILEECYNEDKNDLNNILNTREIYWGTLFDVTSAENLTLRLGNRNGVTSQETKNKIGAAHSEPVFQYTKEGLLIKEWASASEAARFFNVDSSGITACCNGRIHTKKGFIWRHKDNSKWCIPTYIDKNKTKEKCQAIGDKNKKPIIQYSTDGSIIKEWPSTTDAGKELNIRYSGISSCLYKVNKRAGGFMWGYVGEDAPVYTKFNYKICNSKRIIQYSKSGEFIKEWGSISEAGRALSLSIGDICYCYQGKKCKTVGGFIWKYSNNINEKPYKIKNKGGCKKPVVQLSLEGIIIKRWDSLQEASVGTGMKYSTGIVSCCKGVNKTAGGFIWKYQKDVLSL